MSLLPSHFPLRTDKKHYATLRVHGAFTLVELLCVVAILGLLLALSIPIVSKMRGRSEQISCAQRIRTIIAAETLYSADNNARLPFFESFDDKGNVLLYWSDLLAPYATGRTMSPLNNMDWLLCPSLKFKYNATYYTAGIGPVMMYPYTAPPYHVMHQPVYPTSAAWLGGSRNSFPNPGKTPTYMDVDGGYWPGNPAYCRGCFPNGAISPNAAIHQTDTHNYGSRHNGGANVGFLDGHVELVDYKRLKNSSAVKGGDDFFRHFDP